MAVKIRTSERKKLEAEYATELKRIEKNYNRLLTEIRTQDLAAIRTSTDLTVRFVQQVMNPLNALKPLAGLLGKDPERLPNFIKQADIFEASEKLPTILLAFVRTEGGLRRLTGNHANSAEKAPRRFAQRIAEFEQKVSERFDFTVNILPFLNKYRERTLVASTHYEEHARAVETKLNKLEAESQVKHRQGSLAAEQNEVLAEIMLELKFIRKALVDQEQVRFQKESAEYKAAIGSRKDSLLANHLEQFEKEISFGQQLAYLKRVLESQTELKKPENLTDEEEVKFEERLQEREADKKKFAPLFKKSIEMAGKNGSLTRALKELYYTMAKAEAGRIMYVELLKQNQATAESKKGMSKNASSSKKAKHEGKRKVDDEAYTELMSDELQPVGSIKKAKTTTRHNSTHSFFASKPMETEDQSDLQCTSKTLN
ncbi:hypothetical protein [Legionella jordanis]|uniref:EbhA protein n=1 Tax=Legionella jordanis TaxID=456 RepID=A0A0W0V951_9GAMM|nr:hypothetical protein [Legionella jordanis]KTD16679.1 hypothetical protein Ljor_0985 [Legionella jordanis]RMX03788.1 hypothetical protein EAW55_05360 [Legionella jordanis]RMX22151.1 hypothetical protein EAS68_01065 [Legionella jordanis]VEH11853.1 Uncharacterised protein [Legionella jordanis]HAT8712839.1 hypothetical protein [Legionella jordanis]